MTIKNFKLTGFWRYFYSSVAALGLILIMINCANLAYAASEENQVTVITEAVIYTVNRPTPQPPEEEKETPLRILESLHVYDYIYYRPQLRVEPLIPTCELTTTECKLRFVELAEIDVADFNYVNKIITRESRWRPFVWNEQGSSAYGLCQTMMSLWGDEVANDFMTNPISQLQWCDDYAQRRYGSWANAWSFWQQNKYW